jgi:DNA gyrase subunit A
MKAMVRNNICLNAHPKGCKKAVLDQIEYTKARAESRKNGTLAGLDERKDNGVTSPKNVLVLGCSNGKAIRFNESDVRPIGRSASGVRGITIPEDESVVGMAVVTDEKNEILVVTEKGFGKRSLIDDYRIQIRGGMGVKTVNVTEKNGKLNTLTSVSENNDLIITTTRGVVIRMHVSDISQTGRNTQGVILMKLKDDNKIATIAVVDRQDEEITVQPEAEIITE